MSRQPLSKVNMAEGLWEAPSSSDACNAAQSGLSTGLVEEETCSPEEGVNRTEKFLIAVRRPRQCLLQSASVSTFYNVASSTLLSVLKPLVCNRGGSRQQGSKQVVQSFIQHSTRRHHLSSLRVPSLGSTRLITSSKVSFGRSASLSRSNLDFEINTSLARSFWTSITMSDATSTCSALNLPLHSTRAQ